MNPSSETSSLVRTNGVVAQDYSSSNNNSNNGRPHDHNNYNQSHPPTHEPSSRRDPRSVLAQVQRSVASFQAWAVKALHAGEDSSRISWVHNARVARTFAMTINAVLAVFSLVLIGVEAVEMVVREPLLDYLLPESELTLIIAGFAVVAGAFGFAVAYNLLVEEEDPAQRGDSEVANGSGGAGGGQGPRTPIPPRPANNDSPVVIQATGHPRVMLTRSSTYLMTGNAVFLLMLSIALVVAIMQRSNHLSQLDKELNRAWTDGYRRRRRSLISDFELRHHCCGYNSVTERAFPEDCAVNVAYGFSVPCNADLAKDFWRWQKGIQQLLLTQLAMLLPLLALVLTLSVIGVWKLNERKQRGHAFAETQAEEQAAARATAPLVDLSEGPQYERPLLENVASPHHERPLLEGVAPPHHERTPLLPDTRTEPVRLVHGLSSW